MGRITVNGKTISVPNGTDINVVNNVVYINGVKQKISDSTKEITIVVEGNIEGDLRVDNASVKVKGNVAGSVDSGGSCTVDGFVGQNINAGGSIRCGEVKGNADAGGSIRCGSVGGNASAGGSIRGI